MCIYEQCKFDVVGFFCGDCRSAFKCFVITFSCEVRIHMIPVQHVKREFLCCNTLVLFLFVCLFCTNVCSVHEHVWFDLAERSGQNTCSFFTLELWMQMYLYHGSMRSVNRPQNNCTLLDFCHLVITIDFKWNI